MRTPPPLSEDVITAAAMAKLAPPAQNDLVGTVGAQVVLAPDSAARMGAMGIYPDRLQNEALQAAGYVQMGLDPNNPSGEMTDPDAPVTPPPATQAPVNTDVPAVTQTASTLNCTTGNWQGEPTSYAYQWKMNGTNVGTNASSYAVQSGNIGQTATCVVTATNAAGSTAAPPSVGVVVA